MTNYVPHDNETQNEMLKIMGFNSIDDLFEVIPSEIKIKKDLNLKKALSEPDLLRYISNIAKKNKIYSCSFRGAGFYSHYIPSLVDFVISRSEFYTSYTPYQPELSQGFLQAIYEYQSLIARLTDMDLSNASMYDGSTALAEAAITAIFYNRKKKILILDDIHPHYIEVVKTYLWGRNIEFEVISSKYINDKIDKDVSALLVQNPNFFGDIIDLDKIVKDVKEKSSKCVVIQSTMDPTCLGLLKSPGEYGVDIFTAEGQSFGNSLNFGGPGLGIFAVNKALMRKIPGRIAGKTKEIDGDKIGFVLTLQTREQHIRREKATSNICSNQALNMLCALVYLVSLGKTGLKEIAQQNFKKTYYLKQKLSEIEGYEILNKGSVYNEFVVKCPSALKITKKCEENNILAPLNLSDYFPSRKDELLICVTENNTKDQIETLISIFKEAL